MTIDIARLVVFALASFSMVVCHARAVDRVDVQGDPLPPRAISAHRHPAVAVSRHYLFDGVLTGREGSGLRRHRAGSFLGHGRRQTDPAVWKVGTGAELCVFARRQNFGGERSTASQRRSLYSGRPPGAKPVDALGYGYRPATMASRRARRLDSLHGLFARRADNRNRWRSAQPHQEFQRTDAVGRRLGKTEVRPHGTHRCGGRGGLLQGREDTAVACGWVGPLLERRDGRGAGVVSSRRSHTSPHEYIARWSCCGRRRPRRVCEPL